MSDNILQAIDNLTAAMAQLAAAQNNQNIILTATATSSCSCIVGSAPDGEAGVEGGTPPPPIGDIVYDDPDPQVADRKCKAADYLVDWLVDEIFRDILVAHNVKQLSGVGLALALGVVGGLVGSQVGLGGTVIGSIAGLLVGAIAALFDVNLDVEQIEGVMQGIKQDLICALYDSTDADQARANFQQVLTDTGQLSSAEIAFTMLWLPNALLNILFFDITQPIDSAVFFDGYTPVIGCDACIEIPPTEWVLAPSGLIGVTTASGLMGSGTVVNDGSQFVISSEPRSNQAGQHVIALIQQAYVGAVATDPGLTTSLCATNVGQITRHTGGTGPWSAKAGRGCPAGRCGLTVQNSDVFNDVGQMADRIFIFYQRNTPFTLTFSVDTPPSVC